MCQQSLVEQFGTDNIAYLKKENLSNRIKTFKTLVEVDI